MLYYFEKGKNKTNTKIDQSSIWRRCFDWLNSSKVVWEVPFSLDDAPLSDRPVEVDREQIKTLRTINIISASQVAPMIKNLPPILEMKEMWVRSLGQEDPPGGGHGNPLKHSCLENPHGQMSLAGYSPVGSQRVRQDWRDLAHRRRLYNVGDSQHTQNVQIGTENHLHQLGYVHCFDVWIPCKLSKKNKKKKQKNKPPFKLYFCMQFSN